MAACALVAIGWWVGEWVAGVWGMSHRIGPWCGCDAMQGDDHRVSLPRCGEQEGGRRCHRSCRQWCPPVPHCALICFRGGSIQGGPCVIKMVHGVPYQACGCLLKLSWSREGSDSDDRRRRERSEASRLRHSPHVSARAPRPIKFQSIHSIDRLMIDRLIDRSLGADGSISKPIDPSISRCPCSPFVSDRLSLRPTGCFGMRHPPRSPSSQGRLGETQPSRRALLCVCFHSASVSTPERLESFWVLLWHLFCFFQFDYGPPLEGRITPASCRALTDREPSSFSPSLFRASLVTIRPSHGRGSDSVDRSIGGSKLDPWWLRGIHIPPPSTHHGNRTCVCLVPRWPICQATHSPLSSPVADRSHP
jgi:hypothetical protein